MKQPLQGFTRELGPTPNPVADAVIVASFLAGLVGTFVVIARKALFRKVKR